MNEPLPAPFGRFLLRQLLGEGGMAEIFLADMGSKEGVNKLVAVKRMLPHLTRQTGFVNMFLDEARLAARLSHPNIVQLFDFGEVEGRYYLAMEYLAGESLSQILHQSRTQGVSMPLPVVLQIMIGLCDGLHHAHELADNGKPLGLVHRDATPSNLMVTYQGGVKVLDFGIARAAERLSEATETGVVKGKIPYCSPEQLEAKALDRRTDIFALGAVMHELLTGKRLFKRETDLHTFMAILKEPIVPPSASRPEVSAALDRVVMRALERDLDRRYPTMQQFRRDLEQQLSGPPARLDEYLTTLFGADRAREKVAITSSPVALNVADLSKVNHTPTVAYHDIPTGAVPQPTASGSDLTGAVRPQTAMTRALTPGQGLPLGDPPGREKPKRKLALMSAAAAALAFAGLFAWMSWPRPQVTTPVAPPVPAVLASLRVESLPAGAALDVCGRKATAPVTLDELPPGDCVVSASASGHAAKSTVVALVAGESRSVVLQLEPLKAKVTIAAAHDAVLVVNGESLGARSAVELPPGTHALRLERKGFKPIEKTVTLLAGGDTTVTAEWVSAAVKVEPKKGLPGTLDVACRPWCKVYVDGKPLGRNSPIVGLPLPSGTHSLKLEHPPSGGVREFKVVILPGEQVRHDAVFR